MNATLTCEADGATSYYWERQGGIRSIPFGAIGVNTNTLTIINLQLEDAGNYRCVATNGSGSSFSTYATFTAKGKVLHVRMFYEHITVAGAHVILPKCLMLLLRHCIYVHSCCVIRCTCNT